MQEHEINSIENLFIAGYIHDDTTFCDELINHFKQSKKKSTGSTSTRNGNRVNIKEKDSLDIQLTDVTMSNKYFIQLKQATDKYIEKFPYCNHYSKWSITERPNIQYYKPGAGYHAWHTERHSIAQPVGSRHLVYMTYLNDVTDNGETEFFHQKLKVKPQKGLTLIWPSDWTYTHRGVTSLTQDKYIVTGWFNFTN